MTTKSRSFLTVLTLLAAGAPALLSAQGTMHSQSKAVDADIALRASTLGIGLEVGKLFIPHVGARVGINFGSLSRTSSRSNISYDANIKFKAATALLDFYPKGRGSFHVTGGLATNPLSIKGTGQPTGGNFTINSHTYTAAQVGTLSLDGKFAGVGPYLGLGFGTAARKGGRLKFVFDLGAVLGSAKLTLAASGSSSNAQLATDLAAQQAKTQKDIDKIAKVYPVVSLGVAYHF